MSLLAPVHRALLVWGLTEPHPSGTPGVTHIFIPRARFAFQMGRKSLSPSRFPVLPASPLLRAWDGGPGVYCQ